MNAIEIHNLDYEYRSNWTSKRFKALKNLSLTVKTGESFGFLGHNGAGKTTTIKCLLNLIKASKGYIKLFDKSNKAPESRSSVGYLPEQPYFYDHLSVFEIMKMYAVLAGVKTNVREAVFEALEKVNVAKRHKDPMRSLSKGLTQRVAMAQAIVHKPKLLILDEPFSGLDPIGRSEFKALLFELKQQGTTIFVSSHILSDIEFLCDRASIMAHGELKEVFALSDLAKYSSETYELSLRNYADKEAELVKLASEVVRSDKALTLRFLERDKAEEALKQALETEVEVESYNVERGSLEDLFVRLVNFDEAKGA